MLEIEGAEILLVF